MDFLTLFSLLQWSRFFHGGKGRVKSPAVHVAGSERSLSSACIHLLLRLHFKRQRERVACIRRTNTRRSFHEWLPRCSLCLAGALVSLFSPRASRFSFFFLLIFFSLCFLSSRRCSAWRAFSYLTDNPHLRALTFYASYTTWKTSLRDETKTPELIFCFTFHVNLFSLFFLEFLSARNCLKQRQFEITWHSMSSLARVREKNVAITLEGEKITSSQ